MKRLLPICILSVALLSGCSTSPTPTTEEAEKLANVPVYRANVDNRFLGLWASEAATAAYTYSYSTYKIDFEYASHYFTPNGWDAFQKALTASGNLQTVIQHKMMVTAEVTNLPTILKEGDLNGTYSWLVQMPMTIRYQGPKTASEQQVNVNMHIVRSKGSTGIYGLAVKDLIVQLVK